MRSLSERSWTWWLLPGLALPALWPLFVLGLPRTIDAIFHLLRLVVLDRHVRSGMLYPRWAPEFVLGYGYPVFNFYAPSTYYLSEILHLLGLAYPHALAGAFALLLLLAGFGMQLLARDIFSETGPGRRWAPLVAATAYMYTPFLLSNIFKRGGLGEVGAQALLPWVLWSFRRLMKAESPSLYLLPAAFSLGGLAVTHSPTLLFVLPILPAYLVLLWWQGQRRPGSLLWGVAGGLAAIGISAFFWIPLIGERWYLADTGYRIAASVFMPQGVWTWTTFIGTTFDSFNAWYPYQLGLVQALLALTGFLLAGRRDAEWLFLGIIALVAGLGASAPTLPVWLSSDVLLAVQFPWRLLTVMSLPLALFTAGNLMPLSPGRWRVIAAWLLLALIIAANRPWMEMIVPLGTESQVVSLPAVPQYEIETGFVGAGSAREFMPRWTSDTTLMAVAQTQPHLPARHLELVSAQAAGPIPDVSVHAASPYAIEATISSTASIQLRLTSFYFPGWGAILEDGRELAPYPTTDLGLLTVDVPAGDHHLRIRWQGTPLQRWADLITLMSLALLGVFVAIRHDHRWLAGVPLAFLLYGAIATFKPLPPPIDYQSPAQPVVLDGIRLLGYRTERSGPAYLSLYPYWYVQSQPPDLRVRWQLRDAQGDLLSDAIARPWFNSGRSDDWPAGTIVDDAYQIALPPGLSGGRYQLWLQLELAAASTATAAYPAPVFAGEVVIEEGVPPHQEAQMTRTDFRLGDQIALAGYSVAVNGAPIEGVENGLVIHPGDRLQYTLYWQVIGPVALNYHGFTHLVDGRGQIAIGVDRVAGSLLRPPLLWDPVYPQPDVYVVHIPITVTSGLYWPEVGLYDFYQRDLPRLPVHAADGTPLGDSVFLPPVQVLDRQPASSSISATGPVNLPKAVQLVDYSVSPAIAKPGDPVRLMLRWQVLEQTGLDYDVFVHLVNTLGDRLDQHDRRLRYGSEPTSRWPPGEIVLDAHDFTLPAAAPPGKYRFDVGLYFRRGYIRLPFLSPDGALVDNRLTVGAVTVPDPDLERRAIAHPLDVSAGDPATIRLLGYDLASDSVAPGKTLNLVLYWQALQPIDRDYTVFVHLVDETGQLRAQQDISPLEGRAPTSLWFSGEVLRDPHQVMLGSGVPPGRYRVAIGLYDWATGERLPLFDSAGQRVSEDRFFLPAPVIVEVEK